MDLIDFENYIDPKILARGYDYYENDYVTSVEEIEENVFVAKVSGTDRYTVEVELDHKANIIDTQCDCPYDLGEYCKHQVAVFFTLREMKNNISGEKCPVPQNHCMDLEAALKSPVREKREEIDIQKVLSGRTKDELVEFLLDIAAEYEEIKRHIELNFCIGNDEDEIKKSIVLIRTYMNNNSDKWGFVSYRNTSEAVRGADMVLEKARCALERNKTTHAVKLALCIIQEMIDLLQAADDSDGVIGGTIEENLAFIAEIIVDEELSLVQKEDIFDKLMTEAAHKRYDGWTDWRLDLLSKCSELADDRHLRNKLENYLVSMIGNEKGDSWSINYFAEQINLIRYHMIEKYDGRKKAEEFIEQNLQYSDFRKMAIESAMKKKDYNGVVKLTLAGEEQDKSSPGLVDQWKGYRYKAYELSGNVDEQRGIALDFILKGDFEYYRELKSTYDTTEWPAVYPGIIFLLENQKQTHQNVYTCILIEEGEKQKLCEYVKGRPSSVECFYKYLIPEFTEEVYGLFRQYIEQAAARANSRKCYQGVCAIIRNLQKAGGKEPALEIKQRLFNQYANRPAFRDELSRV
jgi:hypothetical protein